MAKKPIKITEVVLRDAHQSLLATRMTMDEMRPILPEMDKIPYFSVECWGGATFDSCIRFLDEDPWERLRILRKELPHQKLQMLFRGQNMLGYRPYADDAVEYFVQKSVANGIDVIRIFDALNDPRNLQTAIKSANKEGAHVQGCISYTLSPVHNNEYFAAYAKTLEEMGANSICIKDMAGLLTPYTCYDLVKKLKETVSIPVDIHSHYTAGLASMSILKGIEAGADIIDTAMSPLSLGTSHMPTESLVAALQGTDYDTGLDLKQLNVVRAYFAKLREKYIANGQISPKSLGVDANTLLYQVPGGMFSNMLKQLKESGGGKTTLVRLLLGLIRPSEGRAFLRTAGGCEEEMNASLRKFFSYVPQGNTLLSGTIAENLRIVRPDASDEALTAALEAACAWEFVCAMPDGLNASVGEHGHGLSEGQAQRIAIARALLRDAPVLLLDGLPRSG